MVSHIMPNFDFLTLFFPKSYLLHTGTANGYRFGVVVYSQRGMKGLLCVKKFTANL